MLEILRDPMWQFIGVVIGIIALIITFLFWKQRQRKALSYEILSNTPLLSIEEKIKGKLQIIFDGNSVENVHLIEVKLVNSGNEPIKPSDYERPINLTFGEDSRVLTSEVIETIPDNLKMELYTDEKSVKLSPILLNGGDSFTLKMIVSQFKIGDDDIKVDGRIAGVKKITLPDESRLLIILMVSGVLLSIIGFVGLIINKQTTPPPPKSFEELFYGAVFIVGYIIVLISSIRLKRVRVRIRHFLKLIQQK